MQHSTHTTETLVAGINTVRLAVKTGSRFQRALRQRLLGSHTPPCHRRMVNTTQFSVLPCCRFQRALGFGLTFPNPKRALGAHGVPHWGSSAPAHHTHPLAMQPAGGAHASSSSIVGGRGRGGREVHLCGAPSGLPLPWFREWKYLQMCSGGGGAGGEGSRRYSTGNTIYTFALVGR